MSIRLVEDCEIPAGWHALISNMLSTTRAMWPSVEFKQVKQKFGSLRVYFVVEEELEKQVSDYVLTFEEASRHTCVKCGSVHTTKMSSRKGWVSPYCDEHTPDTSAVLWFKPNYD